MKKDQRNHLTEVLDLLKKAGLKGVTTGEIIRKTKDASHTKSIYRLRKEGHIIVGERIEGQYQYNYVYLRDKESLW